METIVSAIFFQFTAFPIISSQIKKENQIKLFLHSAYIVVL